nr:Chain P, CYCLIC PEPTIDE [synthetic construct]
SHFNEYE